ncbi:hypothetical protein M0802_013409 [Mischocyttarus mexicanus]|nr:hypothetical protein M0802_013409 [Mischocyttarus mexicanus]
MSCSKDHEIVWTKNSKFYRNYKSTDLLIRLRRWMDQKLHNFHKVPVFCTLGNKRKKLSIDCFNIILEKLNVERQRTVEKDYDVAWTANCTFSTRFKSFARLRIKEKNLASFVLKLSQKSGTRSVKYEMEQSDMKLVRQKRTTTLLRTQIAHFPQGAEAPVDLNYTSP